MLRGVRPRAPQTKAVQYCAILRGPPPGHADSGLGNRHLVQSSYNHMKWGLLPQLADEDTVLWGQ